MTKMVLNQFSRRKSKQREGSGRLTTNRFISFDSLLLSGEKPVPPTSSSLYKNISSSLKENVNPETRISQNLDDFWAVERQKRISAVARRKLSGAKETIQDINQQPLEDRKTRHARSHRAKGRRTLGGKPKELNIRIDADLIADWDKEKLEVEEEKPCTIASSEAFMSVQETALRASLPVLDKVDHRVEAVPGICSASGKIAHTQVEGCLADRESKEQIPRHDGQQNVAKSPTSGEDMDLSSGESPDCWMQNVTNPEDSTPDLAALVEMDWNASSPSRVGVGNVKPRGDCVAAESQADRRSPVSNAFLRSRGFEHVLRGNEDQGYVRSLMNGILDKETFFSNHGGTSFHETTSKRARSTMMSTADGIPDPASLVDMDWNTRSLRRVQVENVQPRVDCVVAEPQEDRSPVSNAFLQSEGFEHVGRGNEDEGCIRSLMHCHLDKEVSCVNHDGTPRHDTKSQRTRTPMTSPTPPPNPFDAYISRKQLLNEMRKKDQRKIAFGSSSSSSSLDIGEDCQSEEIPDLEDDWDRISYNDDLHYADFSECDHEVANTHRPENSPEKVSCSGSMFPHDGSDAKKGSELAGYVCDAMQTQESCSVDEKPSTVKSESRHKSGSNFSSQSLKGKSVVSPGADGSRATVTAIKMKQAEKARLSKSLFLEAQEKGGGSRISSSEFLFARLTPFEAVSDGILQSCPICPAIEGKGVETPRVETPRVSNVQVSAVKSGKTKQADKMSFSAEKALHFQGEDMDSSRVCEPLVSASKSARNKKAKNTGLSNAAKALSFEDGEVEAIHHDEKHESVIEEPQEAVELDASLLVDIEQNTSQPCATLQSQPDDTTAETQPDEIRSETQPSTDQQSQPDEKTAEIQPCADQQSQLDEMTTDTQPCTAPQIQTDNIAKRELLQPSKSRKGRRKAEERRCSLEGYFSDASSPLPHGSPVA